MKSRITINGHQFQINKLRGGPRRFSLWFSHTVTSLNGVCPREKFGRNLYPTTHRGRGEKGELSHNAPVRFGNGGRMDGALHCRCSRPRPGIVPRSLSLKRKFFPI